MSKPFCESGSLPTAGSASPRAYSVGITGSIATGKSAVGKILQEQHGAFVIDTDHIAHELLDNPCQAYDEVLTRFGQELAPVKGGPIDRERLKACAFATAESKAELEAILHPRINERLEQHIVNQSAAGIKVVFILVPLLHEAGLKEHFDEVWCVVAEEQIRLARLMARGKGMTLEAARTLIGLQMSQTAKAKLSDIIIDNSFEIAKTAALVKVTVDALAERIDRFHAAAKVVTTEGEGKTGVEAPVTEGGDAEVTEGDGETGVEAPVTEGGDAEVTDGSDAPKTADPATDANTRYRKILRQAVETGADETLAKLGDVSSTAHQEASARMSLVVDRTTDGEPDLSRQLDVEVKMSVRNAPGSTPTPGTCSCGCGTRCRVDCACMPDCGCGCKKPVPGPVPPVDEDGKPGKRDSRTWLVVLGLFGLLAFLFACLVLWSWHNQPKNTGGGHSVTVVNNLPGCSDCGPKEPPVVVPPVVVPPFNPPTEPPTRPPGATQEFDEVPGFAFRFVHNAVRERVARYEVTYGEASRGSIVKGFGTDRQLLVYQEYDEHHYMTFQYVMTYGTDGSTQVDRFEGRGNIFTGRSIYRFDRFGSVVRAEHYSGLKRPVYIVTFSRVGGAGGVTGLNVEEFDPVTGAAVKKTIDGKVAAGVFLKEKFYVFDWFCQL